MTTSATKSRTGTADGEENDSAQGIRDDAASQVRTTLPALKQEWPMFLMWSEANDFLMLECRLRPTEARRMLGGKKPKLKRAGTGGGFKRWHQKTLLDYRRRLFEDRAEGTSGEG